MATRFVKEASKQLTPGYNQQISALQGQVPAIQQYFDILNQGLMGQQQVGNQNILEGASARGLLRSTIPVDDQMGLGQQIIQQQGLNATEQAKQVGGIQSQVAGLQTDRASAIAQLANALQQAFTQNRGVTLQARQANREYALQKQLGNKQYQLDLQAARRF